MMDLAQIRADFPVLRRLENGKPLVYLDSASTSQKPHSVILAESRFYQEQNANVRRGVYLLAYEATELYEAARRRVAAFIGARPEETVFTRGTTEALNLAAWAVGETRVSPGDRILVTEMEHHANLIPWQELARRKRAELLAIPITEEGHLDLAAFRKMLTSRMKVVAVTHVSNVLGTVNPISDIVEEAHGVGAVVVVDAAQSAPHMSLRVTELGCDVLAFSGHKMLGPTGIGVLWAKGELLEEWPPFLTGGEMIREVWLDRATWADPPAKFEAGTPPIAQAIGLAAAVEYLEKIGMNAVQAHGRELTAQALDGLKARPYVEIYGPKKAEERGALVAFNLRGLHPHDVATLLDQEGICIRAGHHCAQPLHRRLSLAASCRASFHIYNTREEVEAFLEALDRVWEALR